jgi:hypothetical protein
VVIRRRATNAVSGNSWRYYVAVLAGLILFALSTDVVASDRSDKVAQAKACGDARKAGATNTELGRTNGVCEGAAEKPAATPAPPSADEARAEVAAKLLAALQACTALVEQQGDPKSGPLTSEQCDPVRRALSGIDPAP